MLLLYFSKVALKFLSYCIIQLMVILLFNIISFWQVTFQAVLCIWPTYIIYTHIPNLTAVAVRAILLRMGTANTPVEPINKKPQWDVN